MDYKVNGTIKIYQASLLKEYLRREDQMSEAIEIKMDVVGVTITDAGPEDSDFVLEDKDLLDLRPIGGNEKYKDVNMWITDLQSEKIQEPLCQYKHILWINQEKKSGAT